MEQSLFIQYVEKYFPGLPVSVVKKLNEKNNNTLEYRFMKMLKKQYSIDGKWSTITQNNTNVAADIVSMSSQLPLKKRDSIEVANGEIAKIGMSMYLDERQLMILNTMAAKISYASSSAEREMLEKQFIVEIFKDLSRVLTGVYERNELSFLEGLSTGYTTVNDTNNVGTAVRVNFNYKTDHKFGVSDLWSDPNNSKPLDDIERMREKAREDGNTPSIMMIDRPTLRKLGATIQMKEQYVFFKDANLSNTIGVPNISEEKLKEFFSTNYKFTIDIVDRIIKVERDGKRTNINPWQEGMVVFLTDINVGKLVWTPVAEMVKRNKNVDYQVADDYILLSKYHTSNPLSEWTTSQAMVLPVISNVDEIYQIDTNTIQL